MKTRISLLVLVSGIFAIIIACSDPEGCEENPQLCLATCLTDPSLCIDEDGKQIEVSPDSVQAVSELPVRE